MPTIKSNLSTNIGTQHDLTRNHILGFIFYGVLLSVIVGWWDDYKKTHGSGTTKCRVKV